jgi:hypothetical protein
MNSSEHVERTGIDGGRSSLAQVTTGLGFAAFRFAAFLLFLLFPVHVVATLDSPVRAMQAVAFLRSLGLRARATTVSGSIVPSVQVLVPTSREADRALAELAKFASPADLAAAVSGKGEGDQWEQQALPDLSKLPAYLAPPCPGCRVVLPLDSKLARVRAAGRRWMCRR